MATLLAGVLLACGVLLQLPVETPMIAAGSVVITLFGLVETRCALLWNRDSVVGFALFRPTVTPDAGRADATIRDPLTITVVLRGDKPGADPDPRRSGLVHRGSVATPWFVSILYQREGDAWWRRLWPRVIAVWPDSLMDEDFRRLRVLLKWA